MKQPIYYQPILSEKEWEKGILPSFGVYHDYFNAKKDYPKHIIAAYSGDDIEEHTYMDGTPDPQREAAIDRAGIYLCGDSVIPHEEIIEKIVRHEDQDDLIDNVDDDVEVADPYQFSFTCKQFLKEIGWEFVKSK